MTQVDPRAVLDDLADRRRRCTQAIINLASFYLLDPADWLADGDVKQNDQISATRSGAKKSPRRPPGAPSKQGDRILTALKGHGSPMSPGDLANELDVARPILRYHIKQLSDAGLVQCSGQTSNRRISLR